MGRENSNGEWDFTSREKQEHRNRPRGCLGGWVSVIAFGHKEELSPKGLKN